MPNQKTICYDYDNDVENYVEFYDNINGDGGVDDE